MIDVDDDDNDYYNSTANNQEPVSQSACRDYYHLDSDFTYFCDHNNNAAYNSCTFKNTLWKRVQNCMQVQ